MRQRRRRNRNVEPVASSKAVPQSKTKASKEKSSKEPQSDKAKS